MCCLRAGWLQVPKIRCKTMVMSGFDSAFEKDSLQLNSKLRMGVGSWVEIDEAGTLVTEERPQVCARKSPLRSTPLLPVPLMSFY